MTHLPWKNPARAEALQAALARRILIIDGAMGTMIQRHELQEADYRGERFASGYDALFAPGGHAHGPGCGCEGHDQRGNNDLLSLTRPDIIRAIHRQYLEAGADLVETNTFNSTSISLADYRLQHLVRELNREGARLARMEPGETVEATGPFGRFGLTPRDAAPRYLMIATGTGIAPFRALLPELEARAAGGTRVAVLHGVRDEGQLYFREDFLAAAQRTPGLSYLGCLSRAAGDGCDPPLHAGRVQTALAALAPQPSDIACLCGHPDMVDEVAARLRDAGLPPPAVRRERFTASG